MRYFLNTETNTVASLEDGEDPKTHLPQEMSWTPVHLHRGAGPMHRQPSLAAKIIVSTLVIGFGLAVVGAVAGLAAWAWTAVL